MTSTYRIEVECAACAAKMEEAARRVDGVVSASIAFMTGRLTVEFAPDSDPALVMKDIQRVCRRIERDCVIDF